MELCWINPHIRYARDHAVIPFRQKKTCCYDCRLFFIRKGSGRVWVNGAEYAFGEGTVLYFPPGSCYLFSAGETSAVLSGLVFDFDMDQKSNHLPDSLGVSAPEDFDAQKVVKNPPLPAFFNVIVRQAPALWDVLKPVTDEFLAQDAFYRESASAQLKFGLLQLLRLEEEVSRSEPVRQILGHIQTNYMDSTLSNQSLARQLGYHPYYLNSLFRKAMGVPLHTYLVDYRIRMAKEQLLTTQLSVEAVGWQCGFGSAAYFVKQFRIRTGMTPRAYRVSRQEKLF